MKVLEYFELLQKEVQRAYDVANLARAKGFDPEARVEVLQASSLAEKVVGLISAIYPQVHDKRIVQRILELEKQFGSLDPAVAMSLAEEIAKEKFCKFESHHQAIEVGAKLALAYMTLGVVSSPIEGFVQLKLNKTREGIDYFTPFYAGPIRSAGGTEAAFSLVIIDYLREIFGYARYDPTDDEVKRGVHEAYLYHERVTNLQYLPSEEEMEFLLRHVPVQISGDPSEEIEVYNYKDLPRIETNFIRSGFCLTSCEGLAQKAPKILNRIIALKNKGFKLNGWDWLGEFVALQKKIKEGKMAVKSIGGGATYIQDIVAGRPVFAHPGRSGAFRLRYGRCRNTGYSALAVHPATMAISNGFIAIGTQL
ncbi:MAG: DNA polymerase II large subunit, partial [Nanoarchaeota archaeon]